MIKAYNECWEYLKEARIFFIAVSAIFVISFFLGFLYPAFFADMIKKFIEDIANQTKNMSFFQLFIFITENNIVTGFIGIIFGIFFGIVPLFLGFFNGYVLGFISGKTAEVFGYSVLLRLMPHGILELPALILSLGLGIKLSSFIFVKKKKKQFLYDLENSLRVFVYVIIPLLLIAGLIETGLIFFVG